MITLSIKIDCEIMMHVEMDFVKVFFCGWKTTSIPYTCRIYFLTVNTMYAK